MSSDASQGCQASRRADSFLLLAGYEALLLLLGTAVVLLGTAVVLGVGHIGIHWQHA